MTDRDRLRDALRAYGTNCRIRCLGNEVGGYLLEVKRDDARRDLARLLEDLVVPDGDGLLLAHYAVDDALRRLG